MEVKQEVKKIEAYLDSLNELEKLLTSESRLLEEFGLGNEYLSTLEEYQKKLKAYHEKIQSGIVEIAFVGLEKAGKSTLINAIIQSNLLPSAEKRTTYTVTTVRYGDEEEIEIHFYSPNEFLEEVFRPMLREIEYPEYQRQTLRSVSLEDLKNHFEFLEQNRKELYEIHRNSTGRDLEEIIEGREEIEKNLTGKVLRAKNIGEYRDYITHEHKSRAVKELKIYTPALKGMENVVIYDLPGFDSPTLIHSKYTVEKIKSADAVVFLRNAERPSIQRLEAQMITETKEEDGVELREKLFFFLNMVDKIVKPDSLARIKENFRGELDRYELNLPDERVVYGSAMAKLQKLGIEEGNYAIEGLRRLNLDDGIDKLMEVIRKYYDTERKELFRKRVNAVINRVEELVGKLREKLNFYDSEHLDKLYGEKFDKIRSQTKKKIAERLKKYQNQLKVEMKEERITKRVCESIRTELVFDNFITQEKIEEIRRSVEAESSTMEARPDKFNRELRDYLYKIINRKFDEIMKGDVQSYLDGIKNEILTCFVEEMTDNQRTREELKVRLEEEYLKKDLGVDFSYERFGINTLAERFAGDVIQLLTSNPLGSSDRENKLNEIKRDLFSLLAYARDFDPEEPLAGHPIFLMIKYHNNATVDIEGSLLKFLEERKVSYEPKDLHKVVRCLLKASNAERILNELGKEVIKDIKHLQNFVSNRVREEYVAKESKTYEEVLEEVKTDIKILSQLLAQTVINAIYPERAVINRVTRYIQIILEDLDDEAGNFSRFFRWNSDLFLSSFYDEKARQYTRYKKLERVKEILEELEEKLRSVSKVGG